MIGSVSGLQSPKAITVALLDLTSAAHSWFSGRSRFWPAFLQPSAPRTFRLLMRAFLPAFSPRSSHQSQRRSDSYQIVRGALIRGGERQLIANW